PGITNFVSTLPIVITHMVGATTLSGGYPDVDNSVMITCMDNNTPSGLASIMDPPQMIKRAGLNLRGSSTQPFPKSSYAIEFWDEFNDDEEASFAGLPQESDWVLYAPNQFDLSMMHNQIMHQLGRDFGYYSSRTRFVEVFFRNNTGAITATTNSTAGGMGDYNGVYVLEEKVKRDGNRVDIDILQPEQTNAAAITGGYLLKVDRTDGNERTFVGGGMTINYQEPDGLEMVTPARTAQANYIKAYLDNMNNGLQGANLINVNSTNHYSNYLDVDATIDLHIGNVMVMNADGYRLSGYMYKPRGGKLIAGPLWDVDRGLGTLRGDQRTFNPRSWQSYDASACGGTDYGTDFFGGSSVNTWSWLNRLFSDVDFWQRWIDRYQEKRTSSLETNRLAAIVDGFATEVREAQVREQKRWTGGGASDTSPRSGLQFSCNSVYTHVFPTPGTYQGEVDFQKRWLLEHVHFMDTNLLNRPSHNLPEGQVPLGAVMTLADNSGKAGTQIYYTLDGSDPRGLQGVINPAALLYTAPITITNNVRIRARARNLAHSNLTGTTPSGSRNPIVSTPWSGDVARTYYITLPPLVISELMFHPAPSASLSDTNDPDNFEYVELKNIGSNTLNLAGFRFTNGITFTFTATNGVTNVAPGGYVLIVKNLASFTARYGAKTNIAGVFQGNLDNSGERITFVGPRLEPILDFSYGDNWYPLADGLGFSLVILDPTAPLNTWDESQSWRISAGENGSPGVVDPAPPPIPVIFVNEALTHTDLPDVDTIELFNPGATAANISGWYLTDDPSEPKKYQIPNGTTVPAGGFLLIDETEFNG
ncbi:MAG TPA: CotH kinase family protein, partial [Candidatus Limnocylindria bacterium]|nr:CotH kinase family protein [Candidatus Limnocylindria bacterium]